MDLAGIKAQVESGTKMRGELIELTRLTPAERVTKALEARAECGAMLAAMTGLCQRAADLAKRAEPDVDPDQFVDIECVLDTTTNDREGTHTIIGVITACAYDEDGVLQDLTWAEIAKGRRIDQITVVAFDQFGDDSADSVSPREHFELPSVLVNVDATTTDLHPVYLWQSLLKTSTLRAQMTGTSPMLSRALDQWERRLNEAGA